SCLPEFRQSAVCALKGNSQAQSTGRCRLRKRKLPRRGLTSAVREWPSQLVDKTLPSGRRRRDSAEFRARSTSNRCFLACDRPEHREQWRSEPEGPHRKEARGFLVARSRNLTALLRQVQGQFRRGTPQRVRQYR